LGVRIDAGVMPPGVAFHARWPGLGVILTKSAKSKFCPGVCGPPNTEGVIIEEGSAMFFGGGVDGGCMRDLGGFAGDGDVARNSSRSAPSSPDFPFLLSLERRPKLPLLRFDVGVRGGDEWMLKE